jgi:hypothetical protein
MSAPEGEEVADLNTFWNWGGRYVGYRLSDGLFCYDGRQVGYFAEGDEVYGCGGEYIGEVRQGNRLIRNLAKANWTRGALIPRAMKSSPGHRDVNAKEMLAGYEDFPVSPERIVLT